MTGKEEVKREEGSESAGSAGWRTLTEVLDTKDPFFERILFLPGLDFSSNIYIIKGDDLTIVDPGNDYTAFLELFNLGFTPGDVGRIVLTHGHRDHAMGVMELLNTYRAGAGDNGAELILHPAGPRQLLDAARSTGCRVTEVKGGEILDLGGLKWEVIPTPGHTVDGICLYHASSGTAITGDVVLPHAMAEPDPAAGGRMDHYLFGIKALLKRDIDHILPGHGTPVLSAGRRIVEETYVGLMMKVIGVEPGSRTSWVEGAMRLARSGFVEEALYCCEKGLALRPEDPKALQLMILSLNDLGRFREALDAIDRIEKIPSADKDGVFAPIARGYALMGLGKYRESLPFFDEALRASPGMKDAQIYKGLALYLSGNPEEALDIEPFRTEFAGRFKEEVLEKAKPSSPPDPGLAAPSS
jgi:glyoxylase-like metal-dependent hydrolase (beta-lactamase superfamily II)